MKPVMGKVGLLVFILFQVPKLLAVEVIDSETEVRSAVQAFAEAFIKADTTALNKLLDEKYIHVNGGSGNVINKEEWLKWVASRRSELDSGSLIVKDYEIENMLVVIHGVTAVVTGTVTDIGTKNGNPYGSQMRFTNIWIRNGNRWRRAAFHDSSLPESL